MTLGLAAALVAAIPVLSAPAPEYARGDYWLSPVSLPCFVRIETRRIIADDVDAANAEVEGWITEHKATQPLPRNGPESFWLLPAEEMKGLDEFIATQGRVKRFPSRAPEYSRFVPSQYGEMEPMASVAPMIDYRRVVSQRDALRRELDDIAGRAQNLPAIVGLATAYASALDDIAEALRRYRKFVSLDIVVLDPDQAMRSQSPSGQTTIVAPLLPRDCSNTHWDDVRRPVSRKMTEDYFGWTPVGKAVLEYGRTLRVQVLVRDAEKDLPALDKDIRPLGAATAAVEPRNPRPRSIAPSGRPGLVAGYWVPRDKLDEMKAAASRHGRVVSWDWNRSSAPSVGDPAAAWAVRLAEELRGEDDRLTPYPYIQSLIVAHLRELQGRVELATRTEKEELVEFELVTLPTQNLAAPETKAPLQPNAMAMPLVNAIPLQPAKPAALPSGPPPPPMPSEMAPASGRH